MTRGNIITTIHNHGGLRVRFSCPDDGYTVDDLDALEAAIRHTRRQLLEQKPAAPNTDLPTPELTTAFSEQQARMAAPS